MNAPQVKIQKAEVKIKGWSSKGQKGFSYFNAFYFQFCLLTFNF